MKELATAALLLATMCLGACASGAGYPEDAREVEVFPAIFAAVPVAAVRTSAAGLDSHVAIFEGGNFEIVFDHGTHGALPDYEQQVFERVELANGITLEAVRGSGGSERYPHGFAMMQVVEAELLEDKGFGVPGPAGKYLVVTGACLQQRQCEEIFDLMKKTLRIGTARER